MSTTTPPATVVIVTKNRKDELRGAIVSALEQDVNPQILVIDDGSTDGTAEMVRAEFKEVELHSFPESLGLVVRRNYGARVAKAPIIFSLDDDARFSSTSIVSKTLSQFSSECIGAVAIPFVNVNQNPKVHQLCPKPNSTFVTYTYIGTAHAIRRDVFLEMGGYAEYLIHQGEEEELAIRMLDAGYFISMGSSDVINHLESPKRSCERMDYYGRRNQILFAMLRVPLPCITTYLVRMLLLAMRQILATGRAKNMALGVVAGFTDAVKLWDRRKPVQLATYKRWRHIRRVKAEEVSLALL